jgi:acetyl esterase/lipase
LKVRTTSGDDRCGRPPEKRRMTQSAAHLDPELAGPLQGFLDAIGGGFDLGDIPATRHMVTGLIAAVNAQAPRIEGIETRDITAPAEDGGASVPVRVYRPASRSEALPVLLWMHGGGWVLGDLELDDLLACAACERRRLRRRLRRLPARARAPVPRG